MKYEPAKGYVSVTPDGVAVEINTHVYGARLTPAEAFVLFHPPGKKAWNGGGKRNVYRFAVNADRGGKPHPSTKPDGLMDALVRDFTNRGDVVLDAFAGSASTGVAALRTGRRFVGWEKSLTFHAIAVKRLTAAREQLELCA